MKKLVVIFLLLQIVSNNAFAEELIKFPQLFRHFNYHANKRKDIKDFIDFLQKHYSNTHDDDHLKKHNNEDKDCDLPFKHCGHTCLNLHSPVLGFIPSCLMVDFNIVVLKELHYTRNNDRIESNDLFSIWQPPKLS